MSTPPHLGALRVHDVHVDAVVDELPEQLPRPLDGLRAIAYCIGYLLHYCGVLGVV